ncbi:MAG: Mur ligase domain-containing protein, partial [Treponema sp.]|nr:Mur ligase domain-containing protein [Treponema sp.]
MERRLSEFFNLDVCKKADFISKDNDSDPLITGLEYDSRNVKDGNLFFALPGLQTDGSLYIEDAISKGAKAIVHQNEIDT